MTISVTLVSATPERLLYRCNADGGAPNTVTIPNAGGASPDLRTDALSATTPGAGGSPMLALIRARLDGYGPLPAGVALTQAQARALLASDDPTRAVLVSPLIGRAVCRMTQRSAAVAELVGIWTVDVNVNGSGDPVVFVSYGFSVAVGLLEILYRHTEGMI
jgi:hypothetical protein